MMLSYHYAIEFAEEQKEIFAGDMKAFLDVAIECIEKQIPKELKHEQDWYYCPNCEEIVIRFDNEPVDENYRYCSWCGQRLEVKNEKI